MEGGMHCVMMWDKMLPVHCKYVVLVHCKSAELA